MIIYYLLFCLSFLDLSSKSFANNFVEFNIPDSWVCSPYADDWTCQPLDPKKQKDIVVVMSFATQGKGDSMKEYHEFLSSSLKVKDAKGREDPSKPSYVQYKEIMGHKWVDSQHLGSELPNFYTRYLATVKEGRAILITVTVRKSQYNTYMSQLYGMIESMKLRMTLPAKPLTTGVMGILGQRLKALVQKGKKEGKRPLLEIAVEEKEERDYAWIIALVLGIVAFAAVFYIIRRRRKRKKKERGFLD